MIKIQIKYCRGVIFTVSIARAPLTHARWTFGLGNQLGGTAHRLPGLYQILSYSHVFAFRHRMHVRRHKHSDLMAAQFYDIAWDGAEIQ